MRITAAGVLFLIFVSVPAFALEIKNAELMPFRLDEKFLDEIWQEVIRTTNKEAKILKAAPDLKAPKITYVPEQPKDSPNVAATILYWEKRGKVDLERPREIILYPAAFYRHLPERENRPPEFSPKLAYGHLAQEFFHEVMFHQRVRPGWQHCAMIFRETLQEALGFIDRRLGTGAYISDAILWHTKAQCEKDSEGMIRFPFSEAPEEPLNNSMELFNGGKEQKTRHPAGVFTARVAPFYNMPTFSLRRRTGKFVRMLRSVVQKPYFWEANHGRGVS